MLAAMLVQCGPKK